MLLKAPPGLQILQAKGKIKGESHSVITDTDTDVAYILLLIQRAGEQSGGALGSSPREAPLQ